MPRHYDQALGPLAGGLGRDRLPNTGAIDLVQAPVQQAQEMFQQQLEHVRGQMSRGQRNPMLKFWKDNAIRVSVLRGEE